MSYLDSERAIASLKAWRNVPEHASVVDLFCAKLARERSLQEIAADIRELYGDQQKAA
jgi:hypothetical protein